jgi:hypothetical protein
MAEQMRRPLINYYVILKIPYDSSDMEIKKAYRTLAKKYHPDYNPNLGASKLFIQIQQAYEVLSDSDRRKEFDQLLAAQTSKTADRQFSSFSETGSTNTRSYARREQSPPSSPPSMPPFWHQPPSSSNFANLSKRLAKEAYQAAEYHHLGTPYHYYNPWFFDWETLLHLFWQFVLTLLGACAIVIAVWGFVYVRAHGPAGSWASTIMGLGVWTVFWGIVFPRSLVGFLKAYVKIMEPYLLFYECTHGFLIVERRPFKKSGNVIVVVLWTQLQEVSYRKEPYAYYYAHWVITSERRKILIADKELWSRALHEFMNLHSDYSVRQEKDATTWYTFPK